MIGYVYFIVAAETCRVKIGYTSGNPDTRLKALQTGSPCELSIIATVSGDQAMERQLHDRFSRQRIHGEWFELDEGLREYILDANLKTYEDDIQQGQRPPKWARVVTALAAGATAQQADTA